MEFSEIVESIYRDNVKKTLKGKPLELDTLLSIDRKACEYVYALVKGLAPKLAIEVGMAWGYSSVPVCKALQDSSKGVSLIVDPYQKISYQGVGLQLLGDFKLKKHFSFYEERSDIQLPKFFEKKTKIQFGFIDGDHRIDAVFNDFYFLNKMLEPGGVIVFDDFQFSSVEAVVGYSLINFHYKKIPQNNERFAVLEKTKDDDRGWDFYGRFN